MAGPATTVMEDEISCSYMHRRWSLSSGKIRGLKTEIIRNLPFKRKNSDVLSDRMLSRLRLPDCVTILFCEVVSGWALGEKFASLNHTCQTINLYSRLATQRSLRQTVNVFWRGVATSPDTISELTTITDWQLTRHTLWREGMTMQEMAPFLCQHLLPETIPTVSVWQLTSWLPDQ